jgi:ankyrin repeat protein
MDTLYELCNYESYEAIKKYITENKDCYISHEALTSAIEREDVRILDLFFEHGCHISKAIVYDVVRQNHGNVDILKMILIEILENDEDVDIKNIEGLCYDIQTLVIISNIIFELDDVELYELFINSDINNLKNYSCSYNKYSPVENIKKAVKSLSPLILKYIFSKYTINNIKRIKILNTTMENSVSNSVERKFTKYEIVKKFNECLKTMVEHGANINEKNKEGITLINNACILFNLDTVRNIVDLGGKIHANSNKIDNGSSKKTKDNVTVESDGSYNLYNLDDVDSMVRYEFYSENADYDDPLICASINGDIEIIRYLLNHDAYKDNSKCISKYVALEISITCGRLYVVKQLIDSGIDMAMFSNIHNSPSRLLRLNVTDSSRFKNVVDEMVEMFNIIVMAIIKQNPLLLKHDSDLINFASQHNLIDIMKLLVENKALVKDNYCLAYAIINNNIEMVKMLIDYDVDIYSPIYLSELLHPFKVLYDIKTVIKNKYIHEIPTSIRKFSRKIETMVKNKEISLEDDDITIYKIAQLCNNDDILNLLRLNKIE